MKLIKGIFGAASLALLTGCVAYPDPGYDSASYYDPPVTYYAPPPVYYGPPPVYFGPPFRFHGGHRHGLHRHHGGHRHQGGGRGSGGRGRR